jgi:hypothetical protein
LLANESRSRPQPGVSPGDDPGAECTHRSSRLRPGVSLRSLVWRQRCSARRRSESEGHPPGRRSASGSMTFLSKRVRLSRRRGAKSVTRVVTRPPRGGPSGNAETVCCSVSRSAATLQQRAGLCKTAACRLITQRSQVRILPRYQESRPGIPSVGGNGFGKNRPYHLFSPASTPVRPTRMLGASACATVPHQQ